MTTETRRLLQSPQWLYSTDISRAEFGAAFFPKWMAWRALEMSRNGSKREHRPSASAGSDPEGKAAAIYHVVYSNDGFDEAVHALFELVRKAESAHPGKRRVLFLDIEGHRNEQGGFDRDMFELQNEFILGFLMPFLSEVHLPAGMTIANPRPQRSDIPDELIVKPAQE